MVCSACGQKFIDLRDLSRHRLGKIAARGCMKPQELKDRGWWQDTAGAWRRPV